MIIRFKKIILQSKIYLFFRAKAMTYKIRYMLLKQLIKQRFHHNSYRKNIVEKFSLWWFRLHSKPDNALFVFNVTFPLLLMVLAAPHIKDFIYFLFELLVEIVYEILYVIRDVSSAIKNIILFPYYLYKQIILLLNKPWDTVKIIENIKIPLSIHLYYFLKKYVWIPVWLRVDYDWFCYLLTLYLVNYNYTYIDREERWFSYDHQPATWDYNWITYFH